MAGAAAGIAGAKDLKFFLLRSQVLQSYRKFLKTARDIADDSLRKDVVSQIRAQFRQFEAADPDITRYLLAGSVKQLQHLKSLVDMSRS